MSEIRIQKIDGQEFVPYNDYLKLKEEKQELEYLGDINEELKEENKKLKENRSIEIKTCNRYREKCEEYGKEITQLKIDLSNAEMSAKCWEKVAKGID